MIHEAWSGSPAQPSSPAERPMASHCSRRGINRLAAYSRERGLQAQVPNWGSCEPAAQPYMQFAFGCSWCPDQGLEVAPQRFPTDAADLHNRRRPGELHQSGRPRPGRTAGTGGIGSVAWVRRRDTLTALADRFVQHKYPARSARWPPASTAPRPRWAPWPTVTISVTKCSAAPGVTGPSPSRPSPRSSSSSCGPTPSTTSTAARNYCSRRPETSEPQERSRDRPVLGSRRQPPLPGTFADYETSPREYELAVAQTLLRVHTRVTDLYNPAARDAQEVTR
jgi:hypothetical protein